MIKLSKAKRIQAAVVVMIAALLVLTGTFAWYSFNQRRINTFNLVSAPNVNLHDDFAGGPEKDVYVENSGVQPVLVRVRLTELLIQNGVLLPDGAVDDATGTNWHVHTPSENGCEICDFAAHEYFTWTMSGHKFYMPAAASAKGHKLADDTYIEPKDVGDLDAIIDYAALLRTAFSGDTTLLGYMDEYLGGDASHAAELQAAIKAIPASYTVSGVRQYTGQSDDELVRKLNEVQLTLIPTPIMTMQDWLVSKPVGDFWIMDEDGWCYWANALNTGDATGQLLSNVKNEKKSSGEMTYRINVVLNATTFTGTELDDFFLAAEANGGISDNAKMLMSFISVDNIKVGEKFSLDASGVKTDGEEYTVESVIFGTNGEVYIDVGEEFYFVPVDDNGNPDRNGSRYAVTHAGEDGNPGTADDIGPIRSDDMLPQWYLIDIADVTGDGVIDAGQSGTLVRVDSLDEMFELSLKDDVYRVQTIAHGENGLLYLKLDEDLYAVALNKDGEPVNLAMGEDKGGEPLSAAYFLVFPAEEGGKIGVAGENGDKYSNKPPVISRYFYHIGNGIYVEVADAEATASYDVYNDSADSNPEDNTTYYFSSRLLGDMHEINDEDGISIESKITATFSLSLQIGEFFGYYDEPETGLSTVFKGDEMIYHQTEVGDIRRTFTMKPIYMHTDGKLYIETTYQSGEPGYEYDVGLGHNYGNYLNFFIKGMGTNGEFGVQYFGVMVELQDGEMKAPETLPLMGSGTQADPYMIRSRNEMDWMSREVMLNEDFSRSYFKVVKSFDMGGSMFTPIGSDTHPFLGNFDGGEFTISGLTINANADRLGLFSVIGAGGAVADLTLANVNVSGHTGEGVITGGVAGDNYGTIRNCHVQSGTIKSSMAPAGIAGQNHGTITGCTNNAAITATSMMTGGIVAQNWATVENCANTGAISGTAHVGGVVGYNREAGAQLKNSYNTGNLSGTGKYVGGVAGLNSGAMEQCYNTASVTGPNHVGGVVGDNTGTVRQCYADLSAGKKVYGSANTDFNAGGVGGVVGHNTGTVTQCYMRGKVESSTVNTYFTGGVVGLNAPNAKVSYTYHAGGTISGGNAVGGVAGSNGGTTGQAATASLSYSVALSDSVTAGGGPTVNKLTGHGAGALSKCYSWSSMPCSASAGGSAGTGVGAKRPPEDFWNTTVGGDFANASIWGWDDINSLPVLILP